MNNCRHVQRIRPSPSHSILNPQKWKCITCSTEEDIWACISCSYVGCGKYINEHMHQHFKTSLHLLAMNLQDKYLFCFYCQDYVLNDNAAGDIKILRNCLQTMTSSPFKDLSLSVSLVSEPKVNCRRSSRVQKSHSLLSILQNEVDNNDELTYVELWCRRYYLLAHWFHIWKNKTNNIEKKILLNTIKSTRESLKRTRSSLSDHGVMDNDSKRKCHSIPAATGLQNLGNTCYMNSILQVLRHLNPFSRLFLQNGEKRNGHVSNGHLLLQDNINKSNICSASTSGQLEAKLNPDVENIESLNVRHVKVSRKTTPTKLSLSHELNSLLRIMWSGKMSMVSPHKMLYAVWNIIPFFRGYSQQDAQEFLSEFLDKVQSEMDFQDQKIFKFSPILNGNHSANDLVTQLFQGELVSQVKCLSCGHESNKREVFMDLSLEFPIRFHKRISKILNICRLEEMLSQFTAVEKLEKIYSCEQCNSKSQMPSHKTYSEAEKRFMISKLPNVLRLHLKRFMWSGGSSRGKLMVNVEFPRQLDISSFCHSSAEGGSFFYDLSAVVMHHGRGFGSGHYTAYCWNEEADSWLHCNDAKMQKVSLNDVFKAQAYILVYTKSSACKSSLHNPPTQTQMYSSEKLESISPRCNITRFSEIENKQRLFDNSSGFKVKRTKTTIW